MRKERKFVGVFNVIGVSMICFICFIFGRNNGFMKGYKDADGMRKSEGTQPV